MKEFRTDFIGYPVDNINLNELKDFVVSSIKQDQHHFIAVQNANKMYLTSRDPDLKTLISSASVVLPENAINIGMNLLRKPLKQRNMGGVHIMEELLNLADIQGYSYYLLGAKQENLDQLIRELSKKYPGAVLAGSRNGYFKGTDEPEIVEQIRNRKPNILFVGMGSPKQEIFIGKYLPVLGANISLGVGGSFNVLAGLEKPAPSWTKYGLEWLYRSVQDPAKFKRYIKINYFYAKELILHILRGG
jgi:N-acetylglucosaminyldiphosphoundecaprenol N-acetyl-beta-D-mannosaminyltransferase